MVDLKEMALLNDLDFQNVLRLLLFLRDSNAGLPLGVILMAGTSWAAGCVPPGAQDLGKSFSIDGPWIFCGPSSFPAFRGTRPRDGVVNAACSPSQEEPAGLPSLRTFLRWPHTTSPTCLLQTEAPGTSSRRLRGSILCNKIPY